MKNRLYTFIIIIADLSTYEEYNTSIQVLRVVAQNFSNP